MTTNLKQYKSSIAIFPLWITAIYFSRVAFIRLLYLGVLVQLLLLGSEVGVIESLSQVTTFFTEGKDLQVNFIVNTVFCEDINPTDPFSNPVVYTDVLENRAAIMKEIRDQTGIYAFTNMENSHQYIGSAANLGARLTRHLNGSSSSIVLQHAFLKYGISAFTFSILCFCNKDQLLMYEQLALDTFKPYYNILKTAGSSLGYKHTPETLAKISGENNYLSKPVYVYTNTDLFVKKFPTYTSAAQFCNVAKSTVFLLIDTGRICKRQWIFRSSPKAGTTPPSI